MSPLAIGVCAAAGAFGGALVPLPAYRLSVPADQPSRTGCVTCGEQLPAGLGGWVQVASRCVNCGTRLGPPTWLTASIAGVASGLVGAALGAVAVLPLFVALCVLGVLLGFIDVACKRLPDLLVIPAIGVSAGLLAVVAVVWRDWGSLLQAFLGAALLGAIFLVLYLLPGQGLGFGDVKLAGLLGLFLGWLGWPAVLLGALLPWLVNAPVVITLLLAGKVGRKSAVAFGPAMLIGALLAVVFSTGSSIGL